MRSAGLFAKGAVGVRVGSRESPATSAVDRGGWQAPRREELRRNLGGAHGGGEGRRRRLAVLRVTSGVGRRRRRAEGSGASEMNPGFWLELWGGQLHHSL